MDEDKFRLQHESEINKEINKINRIAKGYCQSWPQDEVIQAAISIVRERWNNLRGVHERSDLDGVYIQ